jgi:dephospho-CoA kinase
MRRVALTGGIATGKSYVRAQFEGLGVPTIDADDLARTAVAPGQPALQRIVWRFGARVLDAAGALDRKALAAVVFSDLEAKRDLERIVHPVVRAAIDEWFDSLERAGRALAIAAIPLLYEAGREADFDAVVVTACSAAAQIARVVARDGLSRAEAERRLDAQLPTAEKTSRADYIITTDGSFAETDLQVRNVLAALTGR